MNRRTVGNFSPPPLEVAPKNIAYVTNLYPTDRRPTFGTFVRVSRESLERAGWKTYLMTPPEGQARVLSYFRFYASCIVKLLRFRGIAYVHYVSHSAPPAILASAINPKLKLVLHYHGSDAFPERGENFIRRALKKTICLIANSRARAIVAPSSAFLKMVQDEFRPKPEIKLLVSPSGGVDESMFHTPIEVSRRIDLLFVGRMIEGKGASTAARIAKQVLSSLGTANAVFVGEGPERPVVEQELLQFIREGRVQILGPVPPAELAALYQQAKVFLFPSTRKGESLGLTWIEAGACGAVPVVLANGVTENLVPSDFTQDLVANDPEQMMSISLRFIERSTLREEVSQKISEILQTMYSSGNVAAELDRAFTELISEYGA